LLKRIQDQGLSMDAFFLRTKAVAFSLYALVFTGLVSAADFPQTVKIDTGVLSGTSESRFPVTSFKGIPFAAPPVGNLRWQPPASAAKWFGVRKADQFAASCVQVVRQGPNPNQNNNPNPELSVRGPVSEDCLYLNVWTPAKASKEKLPVMFWIYGGGYIMGSSSVPAYDGAGLASKGVVVVSINYRLGMLGFLALPELDAESPHKVSGNYGILDQIAGLKWVARNIAAFGGDPKRVTIFGQSAGGGSVTLLSVAPQARGLFSRVISESGTMSPHDPQFRGSPMFYKPLATLETDSKAYLQKNGIESLAQLRAMTTEQLMAIPAPPFPPAFFCPVVDGYVFPQGFGDSYAQHKQANVPVIVGSNSEDGAAVPHLVTTLTAYQKWATQRYGDMTDEFFKLYPATTDEEAGVMETEALHDHSRISKVLWAEAYAAGTHSPVYLYYWNHAPPGPAAARLGAFHMSEIAYVKSLANAERPYTDEDWKITDMMSQYWANFAAAGNPNDKALPNWSAFTADGKIMQLGDGNQPISPASSEARFQFFRKFFASQPVN
jgi:carboxylesterase type B